ncbi:hypothetical protein [Streptomyces roseicoloratus]|uniref:Lipoprotein n=1 Tax=Streptomyces roseicoloratus TaxID=2508722 RepID=A0ABY9S0B8_9ACTN|nr:hypothetical protein [Streptomyces roseicoloratus]WMX46545.1 hypothetical protein RGF97_19225 [Streptomyces roseicoloratus]
MVRTRVKLAATLTVVVLALTGFQTSSSGGHGGGKSKSGKSKSRSGGGCSSSKKKNDDYDYDGSGGSAGSDGSGANGSTYAPDPTVTSAPSSDVEAFVVDCVEPAQQKRKGRPARKADTTAGLKVVSRSPYARTFTVVVEFKGAGGSTVERTETEVSVDGNASTTIDVAMRNPKNVGRVKRCQVDEVREVASGATPSPTSS